MNLKSIPDTSRQDKPVVPCGHDLASAGALSLIKRRTVSALLFLAGVTLLAWGAVKFAAFFIPHPSDRGRAEDARRYTASGEYEYFGRTRIEPNRVVVIRAAEKKTDAPDVSGESLVHPQAGQTQSQGGCPAPEGQKGLPKPLPTEVKTERSGLEGVVLPDGTFLPDELKRKEETKPVFEELPPELAAEIAGGNPQVSSLAAPSSGKEVKVPEEGPENLKIAVNTADAEKEIPSARDEALSSPMMGMLAKAGRKKTQGRAPEGQREYAEGDNNLNEKLLPAKIESGTALRLRNRHLTLTKGTFINCILETKVDTTVPGMTGCRISEDVYSMDGSTVLVEAGSRMFGEYRGALAQGQDRVFVLWTQIRTPYGVIIDLDSPGTDPLGGAGHAGKADFHWWERFGNALLFSLIDDSFHFATMKAGERSDGVSYYTTSQNSMGELIAEAMKQSGRIPPTIRINQGSRIGIFTARNIDMSSVYELKPEP